MVENWVVFRRELTSGECHLEAPPQKKKKKKEEEKRKEKREDNCNVHPEEPTPYGCDLKGQRQNPVWV